MEHFLRFRYVSLVLAQYGQNRPYLRPGPGGNGTVQPGSPRNPEVKKALDLYGTILTSLGEAYAEGILEDRRYLIAAREAMTELHALADGLGAKGVGVPFFRGTAAAGSKPKRKGRHRS